MTNIRILLNFESHGEDITSFTSKLKTFGFSIQDDLAAHSPKRKTHDLVMVSNARARSRVKLINIDQCPCISIKNPIPKGASVIADKYYRDCFIDILKTFWTFYKQPLPIKVLFIDDKVEFVTPFVNYLRDKGLAAEYVTDSTQAIEFARRFQPHLMIVDLLMRPPSGEEIIRFAISEPELKGIPIVVKTAYRSNDELKGQYPVKIGDRVRLFPAYSEDTDFPFVIAKVVNLLCARFKRMK